MREKLGWQEDLRPNMVCLLTLLSVRVAGHALSDIQYNKRCLETPEYSMILLYTASAFIYYSTVVRNITIQLDVHVYIHVTNN